jgi:hypothetical protein
MKKTVLTFGLISGGVSAAMMLATLPFVDSIGFDKGEVLGYTTMVLAFLLVFFGIRSYREHIGGGRITFGRSLGVGLLITLVSCACYVVTWEIVYFKLMSGFGDKYAAYRVEQVKASGAGPEAIETSRLQAQSFKRMYDNPLFNSAITFVEPFPVGLVITLLSSAILRKK